MAERTQTIGERIQFKRSPAELQVVITQQIPRHKEAIFFAWIVALFCALFAFIYLWLTSPSESDQRIFFAVGSAFVTFFVVRYGKVFLWRRMGKEMIRIREEELTIRNAIGSSGRPQVFQTDNIRKFGVIPYDFTKFGQFMDRAFWEMGGETLGFEHFKSKIRFGKQLEEKEAKQLARVIEKALVEIPKRTRAKKKKAEA